jgi:hypothetical protein
LIEPTLEEFWRTSLKVSQPSFPVGMVAGALIAVLVRSGRWAHDAFLEAAARDHFERRPGSKGIGDGGLPFVVGGDAEAAR